MVTDERRFTTELGPRCEAGQDSGTTQTIANTADANTFVAVALDLDVYDSDGLHSTSSNTTRITVPQAGYYEVLCYTNWVSNATGSRKTRGRVNGSTLLKASGGRGDGAASTHVQASDRVDLAVNDYVELTVSQNSGGNLDVSNARLVVRCLGPTVGADRGN
jgi:hypothetical protein